MAECSVSRISERVYYCPELSWRMYVFHDRSDAGRRLADFIKLVPGLPRFSVVFGLAAGGVPVAYEVSRGIGVCLDIVVVKKITYPWTTEAGFGAVAPDGSYVFDEEAAFSYLGYSVEDVRELAESVHRYVVERSKRLRGDVSYPRLDGVDVLLVDDGIATGYTMIAAAKFLQRLGARVHVATPTSSIDGAVRVSREINTVIVINLRRGPYFAVADAYREWYDVSDEEVLQVIRNAMEANILCEWVSSNFRQSK